jgi:hypothetical protein
LGRALGLGEDHAEQRERVEVRRLVWVVLDGEQVVAEPVGEARRLEHALQVAGLWDQEVAELDLMAVIGHPAQRSCEAPSASIKVAAS